MKNDALGRGNDSIRRTARRKLAERRCWGRTLAHCERFGRKPCWNRGDAGSRVLSRGHLQ